MELDEQELQKVVTMMMCDSFVTVGHAMPVINKAIERACNDYGYDSEIIYSQIIRELIKNREYVKEDDNDCV